MAAKRRHRRGTVTASVLNVRPEPSTRKAPVGTLNRGAAVTIIERTDSWYKIRAEQLEGFVYGDYVTIKEANPAAGFLCEQQDLRAIPLSPPEGEQITIAPGFSPRQKAVARTWNGQGGLLKALSDIIDVDTAAAVAVLCVESRGRGFGPDGRMIIRFENHIFWRQWGKGYADVFDDHFRFNPEKKWRNHEFRDHAGEPWAPFHGNQNQEWRVLEFARALNEAAALRSISMGGPQIMGFNHPRIGYDSVSEMFDAFHSDIKYQILGLFDFLKGPGTTSPMIEALQRRKFEIFASYYNGQGQASRYGNLIEDYFEIVNALPVSA
jgi:hypothetical protein